MVSLVNCVGATTCVLAGGGVIANRVHGMYFFFLQNI